MPKCNSPGMTRLPSKSLHIRRTTQENDLEIWLKSSLKDHFPEIRANPVTTRPPSKSLHLRRRTQRKSDNSQRPVSKRLSSRSPEDNPRDSATTRLCQQSPHLGENTSEIDLENHIKSQFTDLRSNPGMTGVCVAVPAPKKNNTGKRPRDLPKKQSKRPTFRKSTNPGMTRVCVAVPPPRRKSARN